MPSCRGPWWSAQIVDIYQTCIWCALRAEGAAGVPEASPGAEWLSSEAAREAAGAEGDRLSSGEAATSVGVFELLDRDLLESATSSARNAPRPPPLNQEEWLSFLNPEGVLLINLTTSRLLCTFVDALS